jgi:hypothetical protein
LAWCPNGKALTLTISNELTGGQSYVNALPGGRNEPGQTSLAVPLYYLSITNESGSFTQLPITRDAIAGLGPFNDPGLYAGAIRTDGDRGFRVELRDLQSGSANVNGRTNIQIHIGPGCSQGCSLLQGGPAGRTQFQNVVEGFLQQDSDNGFSDEMFIDVEAFTPIQEMP